MAINKASTCLWSNEMMGHYTKLHPNSERAIPGIMNWAQHSGMPAVHGLPGVLSYQAIQSANSLPQFLDPSLCGNPVSTGRGSLDSRLQFQGSSYGCVDAMTYEDRNPTENAAFEFIPSDFFQSEQHVLQSCLEHDSLVSSEGFKEKNFFRDSPVQSLNSGSGSASVQLTNEDPQGREQADWPGCLQEKLVSHVKPSSDLANLYPKKHRLLSNLVEDVCWNSSSKRRNVGAEGYPYRNHLDSNEYSSACQSIQSGSWSALVQDALGASSSDLVVQEDWSDLTFQNAELSSGSHSAILNENARQQNNWENNSLQGSSSLTSRPFPFCSDADENSNSFPAPTESLMENSYELDEGILPDNSHHFFWHQGEQTNSNQLYQSCHQKQSSNQAHIQDTSLLSGAWAGQVCELSGNYANSANMELNSQNASDIWAQTEKTQFHHVVDQLSEKLQQPHGWISNSFDESQLFKSAGGSSEIFIEVPHADHFVPTIISNSSELNCKLDEASETRHFNCGSHAASDSSNRNSTEYPQHQPNLDEQASDILFYTPAKDTLVSYDNRQKCGGNDASSFSGRPSGILLHRSQYSPHNVQHHSMVDFEITHGDTQNQGPYLKGSSQSFALGSETQNPGSFDHLHFPGLPNFSNAANMRKGSYLETTAKPAERMQSTRAVRQHAPTSVALDRSTSFPHQKRIGQTSQNMPELLHKVDQSREGNGAVRFCSYDHKTPLGAPASHARMLHIQPSASQDFPLGFGPSSQGKPLLNHSFPLRCSGTVSGFGSEPVDLQAASRGQQIPSAIMACQSASQVHDVCRVHDSTTIASPTLPHLGDKKLQQDGPYHGVIAYPKCLSLEGHLNYNAHFRQTEDLYDIPLADQSSRALSATTSSRNSSVNLSSQFYSVNKGHPQQITSTHRGSLSQEHSMDHTKLASKPGMAGGLPKMFHGVWATPSDQQCPSRVKLQKISSQVQLEGVISQSGETNSLIQKMVNYPSSKKGASAPSNTYSTGLQHVFFEERDKCNSLEQIPSSKEADIALSASPAFQTRETVPKHGDPCVSTCFMHPHEQDLIREKHSREPSLLSQTQHLPVPNVMSSNNGRQSFGQSQEPWGIQEEDYSLFQRIQKTESVTSDLTEGVGKRLKESNIDDNAQQTDPTIISSNVNEQNIVFKLPIESNHSTTSDQNSFASLQMMGFSSMQMTEKGVDGSLQFGGTDVPSQDVSISGQQCYKNNIHSLRSSLAESKSQTPTLNGQNGTFRLWQILVCDGLNSSEWSPKTVASSGFSRRNSDNMNDNNLVKQRGTACPGDSFRQITQSVIPTGMASPHSWPLDAVGHPIVPQPKKRKREAPELLPWHKALTQGSQRLCSSSMAEMNWAKTTNRLMEVGNMMIGDGPLVPAHKRLILTTQLMQQIIMSVPAAIIKGNAHISYKDVVYYIANLALGNACSLISFLRNDTSVCLDSRNIRQRALHREGAKVLSKAMEDSIDKLRKLESNFSRLENRASISDVRMEFKDLERCSIIHRFAKFHGLSETYRVETSLTSDFPHGKLLQRQVTGTSMPPNHLEGVVCFSL